MANPDTLLLTGPDNTQVSPFRVLFTPTGQLQTSLGALLSNLAVEGNSASISASVFGVKANGQILTNASIQAGSSLLSSPTHFFTPADIGKLLTVVGAGAASGPLNTTIIGVQGGSAQLSTSATTAIAGGSATFGSDDTLGWNAAVAFASGKGSGTIQMPPGLSLLSGQILWASNVSLVGWGAGKSILKWAAVGDMTVPVIAMPTGSAGSPYIDCQFKDFEIDCSSATQTTYILNAKGIQSQFMVRPIFQNLYVHDTPGSGLGVDFLTQALFVGNKLVNCGRFNPGLGGGGGGAGIGIGVGSSLAESYMVVGNACLDNKTFGIFFETQVANTVATNSFAVVTGNYIHVSAVGAAGIADCGLENFSCTGTTIEGTSAGSAGVYVGNGTLGFNGGAQGLIANNVMNNLDFGVEVTYPVALPAGVICGYVIEGNKITGSNGQGINISTNATQALGELVIRGNTVSRSNKAGLLLVNNGGISNASILDNVFYNNGLQNAGTSNQAGMQIASIGPVGGLTVMGNVCYDDQATQTQLIGLAIQNAIITKAVIQGNDFSRGAAGQGIVQFGTVSLSGWIANNPGFNPQGPLVLTPGASPWTYTAGNTPETLYPTGTITSIVKNTIAIGSPISLDPGESVVITYTGTLTATTDRR